MKIGLCAWSFTGSQRESGPERIDPFDPEGLAILAGRWGLASIEGSAGWFEGRDPGELAAFRDRLDAEGLGLFLDTGGEIWRDPEPLRSALRLARSLGARVVRVTLSGLLEGDRRPYGLEGWGDHLEAVARNLGEVMPLAEELDIPVGMENHQDICSWELCRLCEQVGSPSLGVTMDVGNALAVGETCSSFARRVMPYLKHVHLKDYKVYPTSSGYRLKRCPLGSGVVDWPDMLGIFRDGAPRIEACIELGATTARHIRILEPDYWSTFPQRPLEGVVDAIRTLHQASSDGDWRTPHERGEDADVRSAYELDQLETSVSYLKEIGGLPG